MQSEKKFIIDGFTQNLRCDGRGVLASRVLELSNNTELLASGSSQLSIELSSPHIICGIKSEISTSCEISLSIELAGKSTIVTRERLKEAAGILERLMIKHIEKSQFEIIKGRKAWKLFIDVLVVNENTSNLVEHVGVCVLAALKNAKIIGVMGYVNKNTEEEFLEIQESYKKIDVNAVPLVVSVAFANGIAVLDANDSEENCIDCFLHVAVDSDGIIKGMVKEGQGSLAFSQVCLALKLSKSATSQIFALIPSNIIQYTA